MEISILEKYKYLGSWLYNNLDPRRHFAEISKYMSFVIARLTGVRKRGDLRTNINLFKVLLMPRIRMVFCFYDLLAQNQQENIQLHIRKWFKLFC